MAYDEVTIVKCVSKDNRLTAKLTTHGLPWQIFLSRFFWDILEWTTSRTFLIMLHLTTSLLMLKISAFTIVY